MAASPAQRQKAADVLRAGGTQIDAKKAAGVKSVSTIKRWLGQPAFQAMISSSPEIRPGAPPRIEDGKGTAESQRDLRLRMWIAAGSEQVLGSYIPPTAFEVGNAVVHLHVVQPDAVEAVIAAIEAGAYPAESRYVPVPLAGLNELQANLPLICRLGSSDQRESLMAWLEVWTFIDEEGRTQTLAESLWDGQRRFIEALLREGHVLSIKARKVGLSTLICAHAAWTARIRDVNASVHLLSHREDAARELLRNLRRGFEGLPPFLRLPLDRETTSVLSYAAGPGDTRNLKAFPATPNAAIETTSSHLVLDEWAHTFDPEALWAAVEPTLAPRATSALITTARERGDFVHEYYLRSEAGETRHAAVFVSALERPDRSPTWLEEKRRREGKARSLRNYPQSAEEAFADAAEPYFASELIEMAQQNASPPSPPRRGDRYLKAWDVGRKNPSVGVVLRAPSKEEAQQEWHVVSYQRLLDADFPVIQKAIEAMHAEYPGPSVIEANSIGKPVIQNLRLPANQLIEFTTTRDSKQAMLTEIEIMLQHRTLKIHADFDQLLRELADYRLEGSIRQDSVMALGFAVASADRASAFSSGGRIDRRLFYELNNGGGPPSWWLDQQKITTEGLAYGLVPVVRDVDDPREMSRYQADALTGQLEEMLAQGWRVEDPASLEKLGLRLDAEGRLRHA